MRAKLTLTALLAGLICMTGCEMDFGDFEKHSKDFHYSYPLTPTGRLSVETFNGSVEVSTWDRDTVDISGTKYGPSEDAAESLEISTNNTPDSVAVRVIKPSSTRGNRGAKFVIKVPRTAVIDRITTSNGGIHTVGGVGPARFRTSNGQIRVEDLDGRLDATTSNGAVEVVDVRGEASLHTSNGRIRGDRLRGRVDAETSNGSVDLMFDTVASGGAHVSTSNGGITVRLPRDASARILASTSNAGIESERDLRMRGPISKHRVDGDLGNGGPTIELTTSNGGIHIR